MEVDKNCVNGYVIMEHDFPHDIEIHDVEDYTEAESVINIILKEEPNRRVYIRPITDAEVNRMAMSKACALMGYEN